MTAIDLPGFGLTRAAPGAATLPAAAAVVARWLERSGPAQVVGNSLAKAAVLRRPDWRLEVLDRCGHMPRLEAPDRFVAAVGGRP